MTPRPDHIRAVTFHGRQGDVHNAFSYGVDFVLIDADDDAAMPFFSRNRINLWNVRDRDHGGPRGAGRGVAWVRAQLDRIGFPDPAGARIELLTQPSLLWLHFNPVSFWLVWRGADLCLVIAEVNNTFGERHSYVCAHPGYAPIHRDDTLVAQKVFHVSPFQQVAGGYRFNFDIRPDRIDIRIHHKRGRKGVVATLTGPRRRATVPGLLAAVLRRPFGAARVLGLIHWQAAKLYLKGAPFRRRPAPPAHDLS